MIGSVEDTIGPERLSREILLANINRMKTLAGAMLGLAVFMPVVTMFLYRNLGVLSSPLNWIASGLLPVGLLVHFVVYPTLLDSQGNIKNNRNSRRFFQSSLAWVTIWGIAQSLVELWFRGGYMTITIVVVLISVVPILGARPRAFLLAVCWLPYGVASIVWHGEDAFLNLPPQIVLVALGWVISSAQYRTKVGEILQTEEFMSGRSRLLDMHQRLRDAQSALVEKEKLASVGVMAAGVVHEINNPLSYLKSNFSALKRFFQGDFRRLVRESDVQELNVDLEEIDEIFEDFDDGFTRITTIIRNLRSLARPEDETMYAWNINEGAVTAAKIVSNKYRDVITVDTRLGDIPRIHCRPMEIHQVILNLAMNAAQAAVEAARSPANEDPKVVISTDLFAGMVRCRVIDNGPGVAADIREKIFQPFFTTKPGMKGQGLGLSVSHKIIVENHGGRIEVEDTSPTTFSFYLPIERNDGDVHPLFDAE